MAVVSSFRELQVWQRGMELSVCIYKLTQGFPREEMYGLSSQLRRCGVSVPSNIAEGWGRQTRKDFRAFLAIARGSNMEVETQLLIAEELGYGDPTLLRSAQGKCDEVGRMLTSMLRNLRL